MVFTRGFRGRQPDGGAPRDRVPPGQYVTETFRYSGRPNTPRTAGTVVAGAATSHRRARALDLDGIEALPQTLQTVDIHCVTKWSKLGTRWRGVTFDDLMKAARLASPPQPYVMAHCEGGYTTNPPTADLVEGKAMVVTHFDGAPLADVHGGPARLLVPHLYFWKSAKWLRSLVFMKRMTPASGSPLATTFTGTRGGSSATQATSDGGSRSPGLATGNGRHVRDDTPTVRSITFDVPAWTGHSPGQHVDIRLTAENGYQAERSYSIASAAGPDTRIELTVERLVNGEASIFHAGARNRGQH